jgi:transposase-like protein
MTKPLKTEPRQSKLTVKERRDLAALLIQAGKSNRMIAQELGVDEGTIRSDRKALGLTASSKPAITRHKRGATLPRRPRSRPIKAARGLPSTTGIRVLVPKERSRVPPPVVQQHAAARRQRLESTVSIALTWLVEQQLGEWSTTVVLDKARGHPHRGREFVSTLSEPSLSPRELLSRTRPKEIDMPDPENVMKLEEDCGLWLERWLAACLPGDEGLRAQVFTEIRDRLRIA